MTATIETTTTPAATPKGISGNRRPSTKKKTTPTAAASTDVAPPKPGCTLYIARLPHGFNETELHGYFSQFGQISRLRLSRNRKTGAPKHYAYVEFELAEVAKIVAETMNNYLLFGHLLQCRIVSGKQLHAELFKGAGKKYAIVPWAKIAAKKFNERTEKEGQTEEAKKRLEACKEKCSALGIDYDFESVVKTKIE